MTGVSGSVGSVKLSDSGDDLFSFTKKEDKSKSSGATAAKSTGTTATTTATTATTTAFRKGTTAYTAPGSNREDHLVSTLPDTSKEEQQELVKEREEELASRPAEESSRSSNAGNCCVRTTGRQWVGVAFAAAGLFVAIIGILVYTNQMQLGFAGVGQVSQTAGCYTMLAGLGTLAIAGILTTVARCCFNGSAEHGGSAPVRPGLEESKNSNRPKRSVSDPGKVKVEESATHKPGQLRTDNEEAKGRGNAAHPLTLGKQSSKPTEGSQATTPTVPSKRGLSSVYSEESVEEQPESAFLGIRTLSPKRRENLGGKKRKSDESSDST